MLSLTWDTSDSDGTKKGFFSPNGDVIHGFPPSPVPWNLSKPSLQWTGSQLDVWSWRPSIKRPTKLVRFPESYTQIAALQEWKSTGICSTPTSKAWKMSLFSFAWWFKARCLFKNFLCSKQSWVSASACQRLASRSCLNPGNSRHHQAHQNEKNKKRQLPEAGLDASC